MTCFNMNLTTKLHLTYALTNAEGKSKDEKVNIMPKFKVNEKQSINHERHQRKIH